MLAKTRDLFLYAGRGTGKSKDILAARSEDIIREMPGATFIFTSDTYVNLMNKILPAVMDGWEQRYDFYEGSHFLTDVEPPLAWGRPYEGRTLTYSHTISTYNSCRFLLTSLDRPSNNAGASVVHIFGDESKYMREKKLNKLFPTLRGDPKYFGHSPYFLGKTFTSDMANPTVGEDDWMLRMEANMNRKELVKAIQVGRIVNEIEWELYDAIEEGASKRAIELIEKKLERWNLRHLKARWGEEGKGNTFFQMVSSYANADILTGDYFDNLLKTLDIEEFKISVLSMRKSLSKGERFYSRLDERHFYPDGYDYSRVDSYRLRETITDNSLLLRYCQHDQPLEAGLDVGNMLSLVVGQPRGLREYRVLKNFHTLPPKWFIDLGEQFREYFKHHRNKKLYLYYDRAANNFQRVKEDAASKFKQAIVKDRFGKDTGWDVQLMSLGQGNILHTEEYDLMNVIMEGTDRRLPVLLIDQFNCKELKSSLELAPLKPGTGNEKVQKVKTSEKLPPHRLPMESTNMSDAFKYLICRKEWLDYCKDTVVRDYAVKIY
jgi:hypothetical protein